MLYPDNGSVFNYRLDDAGISCSDSDEALEDEEKTDKQVSLITLVRAKSALNCSTTIL